MRQGDPGALRRAVDQICQARSVEEALDPALDFAQRVSGAGLGAVFLATGSSLRLTLGRNLPEALRKKPPLLELAAWARPIISGAEPPGPEVLELARLARLEALPTWYAQPLSHQGRQLGLLIVASPDLVGFDVDALDLVAVIGMVLGQTLARLKGSRPSS